jgi:hypothetical protein
VTVVRMAVIGTLGALGQGLERPALGKKGSTMGAVRNASEGDHCAADWKPR